MDPFKEYKEPFRETVKAGSLLELVHTGLTSWTAMILANKLCADGFSLRLTGGYLWGIAWLQEPPSIVSIVAIPEAMADGKSGALPILATAFQEPLSPEDAVTGFMEAHQIDATTAIMAEPSPEFETHPLLGPVFIEITSALERLQSMHNN